MAAKSISAFASSKKSPQKSTENFIQTVRVVDFNHNKRRELKKNQWQIELITFMKSLSSDETALIKRFTNLLCEQPETKRVQLQPCELIQLSAIKKHSSRFEEIDMV